MEAQILDDEVLMNIVEANDELTEKGKTPTQGVRIRLTDQDDNQLFFGDVHPNVQYEYEVKESGSYQFCVMLSELAFSDDYPTVRTTVRFSAEFHRSKFRQFSDAL